MESAVPASDHDLLIQLTVNVSSMRDEIRQNAAQVNSQVTDHETRIRVLEQATNNQQGVNLSRKEMSSTVKWVIGTLVATLALAATTIGILVAQK